MRFCLHGPCGQGKREGKCSGQGVPCGRAGLRRCHRAHGEACGCMGGGARPRPVCLVTGSNGGHQDGNFLSAGDGPVHVKPLCPIGSEPGLGPGTLCCKAAMLAPGYTSPAAAKYKGTVGLKRTACMRSWGKFWTQRYKETKKHNCHF